MDLLAQITPTTTTVDWSGLGLQSIMQPVKYIPILQHLASCPNLKMLDLSSNKLKMLVPENKFQSLKLPSLQSLNLSDNPFTSIKHVAEALHQITPNLTDLQISLFEEKDVDCVIQKLPSLLYLNNIPVERP